MEAPKQIFSDIKNWIKLCLVRYELAQRRQTATWLCQLFELPKMACEGSSYVRIAQRSLGVYSGVFTSGAAGVCYAEIIAAVAVAFLLVVSCFRLPAGHVPDRDRLRP